MPSKPPVVINLDKSNNPERIEATIASTLRSFERHKEGMFPEEDFLEGLKQNALRLGVEPEELFKKVEERFIQKQEEKEQIINPVESEG
jgi:hypothetical protein